jgi:hypothetical protein
VLYSLKFGEVSGNFPNFPTPLDRAILSENVCLEILRTEHISEMTITFQTVQRTLDYMLEKGGLVLHKSPVSIGLNSPCILRLLSTVFSQMIRLTIMGLQYADGLSSYPCVCDYPDS